MSSAEDNVEGNIGDIEVEIGDIEEEEHQEESTVREGMLQKNVKEKNSLLKQ